MKRQIGLLSIITICILGFNYTYEHLAFAKTDSNPYRWFWINNGEIEKHGYAMFNVETPYITGRLVKSVGCFEGDRLLSAHGSHFCNGERMAFSFVEDSEGTKLKEFAYDGIIPPGHFFALGTHPNSYDSRYMGLIKIDSAISVNPIFKWRWL